MQHPTHPRLHVRDVRDAHTLFEAVRQGYYQLAKRRPNEAERSIFIRSGSIFVWQECDDELGLKRWTDGRIWSQSRMREPYLFYDERLPSDQCQEQTPRSPTYRFVDGSSRGGPASSAMSHYDRSNQHPMGLVKQAYSAWVQLAPNARPKKWHLTAYFTYSDLPNIPTIDQDPILRYITVPAGVYRSGKARSRNSVSASEEQNASATWSSPPSHSPSPVPVSGNAGYPAYPQSSGTAVAAYNGQAVDHMPGYESSTPRSAVSRPGVPTALPPLYPSLSVPHSSFPVPHAHSSQSQAHVARREEDQRLIRLLNARYM